MVEVSPNLPIDVAFNYILQWKPSQITNFMKEAHNTIKAKPKKSNKPKPYEDNEIIETEITDMKESLEADKGKVLPDHGDWKLVLDSFHREGSKVSHYKTLTSRGKKRLSSASIVDLLGVARDKWEHYDEFTEEERSELGWCTDVKANEPDHSHYVQYWSHRFPKLLAYLWLKFYKFKDKDTMKKFYNVQLNSAMLFDMTSLVGQILQILFQQVEKGGLTARYSAAGQSQQRYLLEFRRMPIDLQHLLLTGSQSWEMEANVSQKTVYLRWVDRHGNVEGVSYGTTGDGKNEQIWSENFCLIVTNGTEDAENKTFKRYIDSNSFSPSESTRIIYCTNKSVVDIHQLVDRIGGVLNIEFASNPVNWNYLNDTNKRVSFLKDVNNFDIHFQNQLLKLGDVFQENVDERDSFLQLLRGEELNDMLRNRSVKLLGNHYLPPLSSIYIPRNVWKRIIIDAEAMRASPSAHIFVITNANMNSLQMSFREDAIEVLNSDSGNGTFVISNKNAKFYLLTENIREYNAVLSAFQDKCFEGKNIHIVRYLSDSSFEWLISTHFIENGADNLFTGVRKMTEVGLLESITGERIILIADSPGMGKSQILASIGRKLADSRNHVVIFLKANQLLEQLPKTSDLDKEVIISAIVELTCCTEFEKKSVTDLVKHVCENNSIKLEVMIDGLDEIRNEHHKTKVLHDMLKVMNSDCAFMRTWLTLRVHMLHEIWNTCGNCLALKIEPFSEPVQEKYLTDFWLKKMDPSTIEGDNMLNDHERYAKYWRKKAEAVEEGHSSPPSPEEVTNFARKCVRIPPSKNDREIAGTPLICRILAEIYESQALAGNFVLENPDHSFASLYEQMVDRKLESYLTEKLGMSIPGKVTENPFYPTLRNEMDNFHTYIALQMIFSDEVAEKFRDTLISTRHNWENFQSRVLAQGIIESLSPPRFIHMTFAEFFVAVFVCKVMQGHFLENIKINGDPRFDEFLFQNVLATCGKHFDYAFKLPTLCQILNSVFGCMQPSWKKEDVQKIVDTSIAFSECVFISKEWNEFSPWFLCSFYLNTIHLLTALFESNIHRSAYHIIALIVNEFQKSDHSLDANDFFIDPPNQIDHSVLECRDAQGRTPLLMLLQTSAFSVERFAWKVEYFINKLGANVHAADKHGNTVLHIVYLKNVTVDSQCENGRVIPCGCKGHDDFSIIEEYLLAWQLFMEEGFIINGESLNAKNDIGDTPLSTAVRVFGPQALPLLKFANDHGADLNIPDGHGRTLLHYSLNFHSRELVSGLLNFGADASVVDGWGYTPLLRELENKNFETVKMLIEAFPGAVQMKSGCNYGWFPLHLAVLGRRIDIVKMLVEEYDADINAIDNEGITVVQYDTRAEIREYLESRNNNPSRANT